MRPEGFPEDWSPAPVINLLVAYPYVTPDILAFVTRHQARCRWLIDSGAFTAAKSGIPIKLDDYCRFIDTLPVKPWRYFALDVVGDQDASKANYYAMRERGYDPIPIVTRDGPRALTLADEYWQHTDIVGFGGLGMGRMNRVPYVKAVLEHSAGRRVHLLGFSSLDVIGRYRPYMADSASWTSSDRWAWLWIYHGGGRWSRARKLDDTKPFDYARGMPAEHAAAIRNLGFDAYALQKDIAWRGEYGAARLITCAGWMRMSVEIERRFGTKLFIAMAADSPAIIETAFLAQQGEIDGEARRQELLTMSKEQLRRSRT
jgi:hypothetical protein